MSKKTENVHKDPARNRKLKKRTANKNGHRSKRVQTKRVAQ